MVIVVATSSGVDMVNLEEETDIAPSEGEISSPSMMTVADPGDEPEDPSS